MGKTFGSGDSATQKKVNNSAFTTDITVAGATPSLTIGDAGEEDSKIVFDGAAQDYYIGLDDTDDDLKIGKGSAVGTTTAIAIDENLNVTVGTDLTVTGGDINYGNAQDANLGVDTTASGTDGRDLTISAGSAPAGSANQSGGDLILNAGAGDGSGTSKIILNSKVASTDGVATRLEIGTAGLVKITSLSETRAVATDANKNLVSSATTATELGYVNGVSSAIQTQLNSKTALTGSTNNTIATVTGAHAIQGEAKFFIEGTGLTIGNATAEDTKIVFDGNAQDYYIGLDDSIDNLVFGKGSALGTTQYAAFTAANTEGFMYKPHAILDTGTGGTTLTALQSGTTVVLSNSSGYVTLPEGGTTDYGMQFVIVNATASNNTGAIRNASSSDIFYDSTDTNGYAADTNMAVAAMKAKTVIYFKTNGWLVIG